MSDILLSRRIGDDEKVEKGHSISNKQEQKKRGLTIRSLQADNISIKDERAAKGEPPKHQHVTTGKENMCASPYLSTKESKYAGNEYPTKLTPRNTNTPPPKICTKTKRIIDQQPVRTPVTKRGATCVKMGKGSYRSPLQIGMHNLVEDKMNQESHVQSLSILSPKSKASRDHMMIRTPPKRVPLHEEHGPRLIKSGPMRVPVKRTPQKPTQSDTCPRMGFDGTRQTPSKELLKSTSCSRSQQVSVHSDTSAEKIECTELREQHPRLSPTRNYHDRTQHRGVSPGAGQKNIPPRLIMTPVHPRTRLSPRRTKTPANRSPTKFTMPPPCPSSQREKIMLVCDEMMCASSLNADVIVSDMDSLAINTEHGTDLSIDSSIAFTLDEQNIGSPVNYELDLGRYGCADPVAMALLNDDDEELGLFLERINKRPQRETGGTFLPSFASPHVPLCTTNAPEKVEGAERTDSQERVTPEDHSLQDRENSTPNTEVIDERDSHSAVAGDTDANQPQRKYGKLRKVSSRLLDLMGDDEVASLHRPVAKRAKSPIETGIDIDVVSH